MDPAGQRDSFAYDVEGQLRCIINRRGQTLEFTYDALHRRLTRTGRAIASDTISHSGDARVIAASNAVAVDSTFLNSQLQPDIVRTRFRSPGDPSRVYERRYWYQATSGLLDSVTATGPSLTLLSRGFAYTPTRGTLDSLRFGPGAWTRLHRNSELAVDTTRFPNNDALALGYVTADDLDRISSPLMDDRYNRDARGRIRQVFPQPNVGREFKYDSLGHLRRLVYGVPDGMSCYDDPDLGWICDLLQDSTVNFEHDPVGNRTLRRAPGGDAVGTYGPGDRILTYGGCSYGTDFDGNVTSRACGGESVTFDWSGDGRLTGYTIAGGPTVGLFYDAAGRLVRRDVNGAPASYFLWDGDNLLAELDGNQYLVAQYSYYPGLDRLHAFNRGGSVSYAQADAEGNVRYLGTNVYNQVRSYVYDESGNLVGGTDWGSLNGIDRARWKGALYLAPDAGLYYMRARWYEPRSGRFLSEDPAGLSAGLNPYTFAASDPINAVDPTGRCWVKHWLTNEKGEVEREYEVWSDIGCPDDGSRPATAFDMDPNGQRPLHECADNVFGGTAPCPTSDVPTPRPHRIPGCRRGFTTAQCVALVKALQYLFTHPDPKCRALGTAANARFLNGQIRFDARTRDYGRVWRFLPWTWLGRRTGVAPVPCRLGGWGFKPPLTAAVHRLSAIAGQARSAADAGCTSPR